jgi:hypothetical protein
MDNSVMAVDWSFISRMEGGSQTKGYIPLKKGKVMGKSGLTIGTGWDVGQMTAKELKNADIPESVKIAVEPFVGLRGQAALDKLNKLGAPRISIEDASIVDKYTHSKALSEISKNYETSSGKSFDNLTSAQQTVIASVGFQYGSNLKKATPGFWKQVTSGDWESAHKNLQNFGDIYDYRRGQEARILGSDIANQEVAYMDKWIREDNPFA